MVPDLPREWKEAMTPSTILSYLRHFEIEEIRNTAFLGDYL
jgi:hypothetical protein